MLKALARRLRPRPIALPAIARFAPVAWFCACGGLAYAQTTTLCPSTPGKIEVRSSDCASPIEAHHDGTFENGIAWHRLGQAPPYYGAFGEAFSLGPGSITCMAIWLTRSRETRRTLTVACVCSDGRADCLTA